MKMIYFLCPGYKKTPALAVIAALVITISPTVVRAAKRPVKKQHHNPIAIFDTVKGKFIVELLKNKAPSTVEVFVTRAGLGYYYKATFNRWVVDYVIQAGRKYKKKRKLKAVDEREKSPSHLRGSVSMALKYDDIDFGCRFFICLKDQPVLNKKYPVFGQVIEGMDVVDELRPDDRINKITIRTPKKKKRK
jgi:peptidyl-prolyl cis-trans isomerase B (cyclophilin B)